MNKDDQPGMTKTALDFTVSSIPPSIAIIELVRHLARISAEQDYKFFLKSIENRYAGGLQKGPPK